MTDDLRRELEDQIVNGDGLGENFTGILNAGILTEGAGSGPFYAIRSGITQIETTGRTSPTAIVANPTNVEEWDLAVVNSEANHFLGDPFGRTGPRTLWGLPVISTDVIAEGTALVGDFRKAILWDREQATISVGTVGDDFVRNIVRVLAELRAGFGVLRPSAFVAATV